MLPEIQLEICKHLAFADRMAFCDAFNVDFKVPPNRLRDVPALKLNLVSKCDEKVSMVYLPSRFIIFAYDYLDGYVKRVYYNVMNQDRIEFPVF